MRVYFEVVRGDFYEGEREFQPYDPSASSGQAFFELCRRHLSPRFTWNVERTYPSGKSDPFDRLRASLEFVRLRWMISASIMRTSLTWRWVIEFKYYSNADFNKLKTSIDAFELQEEDKKLIAGYVEGLIKEYPEAQISPFVIYCSRMAFASFRWTLEHKTQLGTEMSHLFGTSPLFTTQIGCYTISQGKPRTPYHALPTLDKTSHALRTSEQDKTSLALRTIYITNGMRTKLGVQSLLC